MYKCYMMIVIGTSQGMYHKIDLWHGYHTIRIMRSEIK